MIKPLVLSPAQQAEFPGENLSRFALDYIAFQRSSPETTKKKNFAYFAAPDAGSMDEDDVLYGDDREACYKRLMWSFRKCQRARAFDRYFDAAHNQFYESSTVPGLVLLKEWTSEATVVPGLYTGSFRAIIAENYDQVWLCVRGLKAMPKNPVKNIVHVPLLSPSQGLWYHYLDLRNGGKWDERAFREDYAPKFLAEMLRPEPYAKLQALERATRTQSVLAVCYCTDESLCHRSLIRRIVDAMRQGRDADGTEDR